MKLLITGGTGFLGTALVKRLHQLGHECVLIIRESSSRRSSDVRYHVDNQKAEDLHHFFNTEKFDGVLHLATHFLAEHKPQDIPSLVEANILFGTRLLEAAVASKVKWFLNTGTFWQHFQDEVYHPVNLYAATKQAFEDLARYYYETSPIVFCSLHLSDTIGSHDTRKKLPVLLKNAMLSGTALDMSPGEQEINILDVEDVMAAYQRLLEILSSDSYTDLNGKVYAASAARTFTLKEIVELFSKVGKRHLHVNWGARNYRAREVMKTWSKFELVPGWVAKIPLEESIRNFLLSST